MVDSFPVQPRILDFYIECPPSKANENRCVMLHLKYDSTTSVSYRKVKERVQKELKIPPDADFDLEYERGDQEPLTKFNQLIKSKPCIRLRVGLPVRFLENHNMGLRNMRWKFLAPNSNLLAGKNGDAERKNFWIRYCVFLLVVSMYLLWLSSIYSGATLSSYVKAISCLGFIVTVSYWIVQYLRTKYHGNRMAADLLRALRRT